MRPLANVLLDDEATLGSTLAERALAIFINYPLPPWVGHVLSSVVLHQDAGLLYGQSRTMRAKGYNFARRSALGDGRIGSSRDNKGVWGKRHKRPKASVCPVWSSLCCAAIW